MPGLHGVPAVHGEQAPFEQTALVPHDVPLVTFVAPSQAVAPLAHDVVPAWHWLPPGLHTAPAVHAPH